MKYTHLVWDFNGTILDDIDVGIDAANVLLGKRGLPLITSKESYKKLFGFPIVEYYKVLGFDFEKENYDDVAVEWVKEYLARVPNAPMHKGAVETMVKVNELGIPQILLSATELNMLKGQVAHLGIADVFSEIYGLDNVRAGSKKMLAEQLREKYPNGRFLFLGDTDHDHQVAQAAGADCVLFAGGHQSKERLLTFGPPVIDSLSEIVSYL